MWIICMFDLPTKTKTDRHAYSSFRKRLLIDGFIMMQYSVYTRHCSSAENAQTHIRKMSTVVPDEGEVRFLIVTDNQFERILTYQGKKMVKEDAPAPTQLQLF